MKILMAYSSKTGNTKKLCTGIYNNLSEKYDIDFRTVKESKDVSEYDLIFVGFWVDKGTTNSEVKRFLSKISGKKIALVGTLGAAPESEHGMKVLKKVPLQVKEPNEYLGAFICRGKVDPKLTNAIKFLPLSKGIREQMYEASITSREPNEEDIQNGTDFVEETIKKVQL